MADLGLINYAKRLRYEGKSDDEIRSALTATGLLPLEAEGVLAATVVPQTEERVISVGGNVLPPMSQGARLVAVLPGILIATVLVAGGLFYWQKQREEKMMFDITVQYVCAVFEALKGNPEIVFESGGSRFISRGELEDFISVVGDEVDRIKSEYRLNDTEFREVLETIKSEYTSDRYPKKGELNREIMRCIKK